MRILIQVLWVLLVLPGPANEFMAVRIPGYREALASAAAQFRNLIPLSSLGLMAFSTASIPA